MVFLDASAIIYLMEGDDSARSAVREALTTLRSRESSPVLGVSALSRLECRVRPLREKDDELLSRYERFFSDPGLIVITIDVNVLDHAAELRAKHGLRTPDALQAASMLATNSSGYFVTGDNDFNTVEGLQVHQVRV